MPAGRDAISAHLGICLRAAAEQGGGTPQAPLGDPTAGSDFDDAADWNSDDFEYNWEELDLKELVISPFSSWIQALPPR